MSDEYSVMPDEPKLAPVPTLDSLPLTEEERKNVQGLGGEKGCLYWGCIFLGSFAVISAFLAVIFFILAAIFPFLARIPIEPIQVIAFFLAAIVATITIFFMNVSAKAKNVPNFQRKKAEYARRVVEQANQREKERVESEATALTSKLRSIHLSCSNLTATLPLCLSRASECLKQAEAEYNENAFSPFWECVEKATEQLGTFNDGINHLSASAPEYNRLLQGKRHSFPVFPLSLDNTPDASPVVKEFRRIVRLGHTNHDFADIWEIRRTQAAVIAGFRTFGEAVNNLSSTLECSISNLQQSVASDLAILVQEEINTRDVIDVQMREQNRLLDAIHNTSPHQ